MKKKDLFCHFKIARVKGRIRTQYNIQRTVELNLCEHFEFVENQNHGTSLSSGIMFKKFVITMNIM